MADVARAAARAGTVDREKDRVGPQYSFNWRVLIPLASLGFALLTQLALPAHPGYTVRQFPYYTRLLALLPDTGERYLSTPLFEPLERPRF